MNEIRVCRRHGVLRQKEGTVKLKFTGQDLDRAFELMGATVRDVVCPECIQAIEKYIDGSSVYQPSLFDEGHRGN